MISRLAAAKVNLDLRVISRRADGYHELDSLVVFSSVGDRLAFEHADALELHLTGPYAGALENEAPQANLVLRAAELLRELGGDPNLGARITLTKNLPVASGLGGGSADAAATLSGLAALWGMDVGDAELARLGLKLGADVPVCLLGRPCYLGGIGEEISELTRFPRAWLVLINPRKALSTPEVFKAFDGRFSSKRDGVNEDSLVGFASLEDLLKVMTGSWNDLEPPAIALVPEIADCLAELRAERGCRLARMSGSGASCFGLFASHEEASSAARSIGTRRSEWWVAEGDMGGAGRS